MIWHIVRPNTSLLDCIRVKGPNWYGKMIHAYGIQPKIAMILAFFKLCILGKVQLISNLSSLGK